MALFHVSEGPDIRVFAPQPGRVGVDRGPANAWLNGPLVRSMPRTARTSPEDRAARFGDSPARAIASVEAACHARALTGTIHRDRMPADTSEPLGEVGASPQVIEA